jgi:ubiquinone/menaquinone biosynthesis C-methylase UbiE
MRRRSRRGPVTRLGLRERACIALGSTCRRVFPFPAPLDVEDPTTREDAFERAAAHGAAFGRWFRRPFDVRGKRVLEIGCGNGGMQLALIRAGAAESVGIDVSDEAIEFAAERLRDHPSVKVMVADAQSIPAEAGSFDVVVSSAAFEHVHDIEAMLCEVERVLRPGGVLYAQFSPLWWHYNGPHLIKCVSVPWAHVLFSDRTLLNVLSYHRESGTFPRSYLDEKIEDFQRMGRLSLRKFRRAAARTGLEPVQVEARSPRRWKDLLNRLPVLEEIAGGTAVAVLRKP